MIQPGSPAFSMPPAEDDQVRRQRDIQRQQMENAAARSMEATSIGEGGLTVVGGFINITNGGTFLCDGAATFNGSLSVPAGSLNTAGSITAGASLNANSLAIVAGATVGGTLTAGAVSAGTVTSTGDINASGYIRGGNIYGNILSVDYRVVYVTGVDGALGHVPSSAKYKTDIRPANLNLDAILNMNVHTFKYKDAVAAYGSLEAAPTELGLIAEEVDAAGLGYLVYRGTDGSPEGVAYERLGLPLLAVVKDHEARLRRIEQALGLV